MYHQKYPICLPLTIFNLWPTNNIPCLQCVEPLFLIQGSVNRFGEEKVNHRIVACFLHVSAHPINKQHSENRVMSVETRFMFV